MTFLSENKEISAKTKTKLSKQSLHYKFNDLFEKRELQPDFVA